MQWDGYPFHSHCIGCWVLIREFHQKNKTQVQQNMFMVVVFASLAGELAYIGTSSQMRPVSDGEGLVDLSAGAEIALGAPPSLISVDTC